MRPRRFHKGGLASNALLSVSAHIANLAVSFITVAILPLTASVETFGHWTLYTLLASFVYILSFGLNDGVLLRLGGKRFDDLHWPLLFRFFRVLASTTVILGITLAAVLPLFESIPLATTIGLALSVPLLVLTSFFSYTLLATNRISPYVRSLVYGRIVFVCLFGLLLIPGPSLGTLILAELIGRATSFLYAMWACRPVLRGRRTQVKPSEVRSELWITVRTGSILMFAGITSMATDGVVRLVVQSEWGIAVFAGLSLSLSAAHLITSFLRSVATVVFPWLRRVDQRRARQLFGRMSTLIAILSIVVFACYFPMRIFITSTFSHFDYASEFLIIVVPVVACQARATLLVTPFLNSLYRERTLLLVNAVGLLASSLLAIVFAYAFRDLMWTVSAMLIGQVLRVVTGELAVRHALGLKWVRPFTFNVVTLMFFLVCALAAKPVWTATFMLAALTLVSAIVITDRNNQKRSPTD